MEIHLPIQLEKATEMLMQELPKRSQNVLERRFGLKGGKRATLDAIGKTYNITRERVRQIENDCFNKLRKSEAYKKMGQAFQTITIAMQETGGVVVESALVRRLSVSVPHENHAHFLLALAHPFKRATESEQFHHRWYLDDQALAGVEQALALTAKEVRTANRVFQKNEILAMLMRHAAHLPEAARTAEALEAYLALSKEIGSNNFGEWGPSDSALIRPRGMRDMAYLVLKREGKPLHFLKTAELIGTQITKRPVHAQTVHNELIKDSRFVLVGRGTYGLKEWGYEPGIVRDVIARVLKGAALTKEEIMHRVLETRQVKENTVVINLQNKNYFKKLPDGRYTSIV